MQFKRRMLRRRQLQKRRHHQWAVADKVAAPLQSDSALTPRAWISAEAVKLRQGAMHGAQKTPRLCIRHSALKLRASRPMHSVDAAFASSVALRFLNAFHLLKKQN